MPPGGFMSTTTRPPTSQHLKFFAHANPSNPLAQARAAVRRADYDCWRQAQPDLDADIDTVALSLVNAWGLKEAYIKSGLRALNRLDSLPKLKQLQETHYLLDMAGLIAIDGPMQALAGPDVDTLALIDDLLVDYFTADQPHQVFPTVDKIRRRMRDICRSLDDTIAYRDTRPKDSYAFSSNGTKAWIELGVDEDTGIKLDAFIRKTASTHGISITDAMKKLLSGEITPPATVILHTYRATDVEGAPTFIENHGWRSAPMPHTRIRDLFDDVEPAQGYVCPEVMRKIVEGRDGTCRVGGCNKPAYHSQMDHRHNYSEGGATHPSNLGSLCQGHHNMKTDGRLHYLIDPYTGDIVWLFDDGTWTITQPEGPLAPKMQRWAQTVGQHITNRRTFVREQAQKLKEEIDEYNAKQKAKAKEKERKEAEAKGDDLPDDIPF